jgi:hypothetical protein
VTTKLDKPLKREIEIEGKPYTLTLTEHGLKLVEKGHRKGHAIAWADILSGSVALTAALAGSVSDEVRLAAARGIRGP